MNLGDLDGLLDLLAERVTSRVVAHLSDARGNERTTSVAEDTLLDAAEAASRLGVTKRWIYSHARALPFVVRLQGRAVRFSACGIQKYIARRRGG